MHPPINHHQAAVSQLGNVALLRAVATCAGYSRQALVRLLRGLGEVEARSLHAADNTVIQRNRASNTEIPTGAQNYRLHVTLDVAALQALRQAQDLLGHRLPTGDLNRVVGMALQGLVERLQAQKFGKLKIARAAQKRLGFALDWGLLGHGSRQTEGDKHNGNSRNFENISAGGSTWAKYGVSSTHRARLDILESLAQQSERWLGPN